ncbi:xanthine dehydrogenase subunit D [Amycolatopsis acidiphila]|uniref:Xanthine dehydrogenase subunit D n=1 Tax=Amycolatopsis acidiphila TaxID=715473 RepID=A0A558A377_9PSEU|nr:xanthine dehydrogenase subunit D [Amycolatopsis acidiphila]TVT18696.1 xanthine dehydrogenase subunit D [Amycolatopsis acidiphila]UIJ61566.1 xanthine dehydrogenase subunit D [Amycolatopsis acidiphila]GHG59191.1 carbon-monoxide dehydrogenase large subunit [Amycolatopsis acidiphila]
MTTTEQATGTANGIGTSPRRPDGTTKVRGEFAYSSDLWHEDMLWGATLRSPHPYARIKGIDITEALAVQGVYAVLTHEDVPGVNRYGLEHPDQPVLAVDVVRYQGEPVAVVAADHPETARRAIKRIEVEYEVLAPVTDAEQAVSGDEPAVHPGGNVVRHVPVRRGDPGAAAEVVVTGTYEVGMQDQAFLGPESGLAVPAEDGGVDLFVATQWLHVDQRQIVAALGLPEDKVRLTLGGVGGAFGGREDLSIQVHACLLALHTGKPVKMVYNREESFYGHVHRHPATMHYEHGADRDGKLVYVKARLYLDGGAYASSTGAVVANAATLGVGPYDVPNVSVDCWGAYTNNPPCGAMRGFGAVQAAFGYESQMDKLAEACGLDPVEIRVRNAMSEGSVMPTGQVVDSAAPVVELLRRLEVKPLPPAPLDERDLRTLPGGVSNTTHGEGVVRGVGYAVGIKNICFSEGFDDYSTARVRLQVVGGEAAATVQTAACEVGQGLVTVLQQIVRSELGVEQVTILPMDTTIGNAGSTSASRQTYVTGGAVRAACLAVRSALFSRVKGAPGDLSVVGGKLVSAKDGVLAGLVDVLGDTALDETVEWRHRPTETLDPETGAGDAHVQYGFAAHRAVVDVDVELGLVKVVSLDCAQDVGKALNPQAVLGQIHGGSAQGLGLAVMEEIQTAGGKIRNPSFTDYLIPTVLDMPPMSVDVLELADPHAPYGLRGVGEPPTISSTPAIVAAIRAATGKALTRVPVRPEHITGT